MQKGKPEKGRPALGEPGGLTFIAKKTRATDGLPLTLQNASLRQREEESEC